MQVKLLAEDSELYVFAQSVDRVSKERAMRRRQLKWLWKRRIGMVDANPCGESLMRGAIAVLA